MDKDTKTSPDKNDQKNTDYETKLQTLRSLIQEGIDSGEVEYSYDEFMEEMDDELGERVLSF
ncbi:MULTISPECIES: ribbon-helix-helix domain-containing protein [Marinomonas]|uniref:Type II toxin-antitoxin system ParD family antitoxin n=1 Tax=Marinomonas arctica TaxID=383750 RepID=A0A7H1J236_9GAMM|nr:MULTISPECIES: type II toxin-antitoxin system ParD family antitoxin [Marinomonas]MCS7488202.1 hypothetical protein [Marinomonas sp. BSi20414]QNT04552.1 type II toxin-antitoxin system ParD family antitoxin [Marinomonas arctica]GGN36837.1 hypothetical protein GCM10011350_35420 [Marinomonas arctica]